jgi:hypothetical protein
MPVPLRFSRMVKSMFCLSPSVFLILASVAVVSAPCRSSVSRHYRFGTHDYHVMAEFSVACPRDSALVACFDFDHVKRFLTCPSLVMSKIGGEKDRQRYLFAYNYVVYRCTLDIKYELKNDSGMVRYALMQSSTNNTFFPAMVELSGCYKVECLPHSDSVQVTYEQNARMSKKLNILYTTEIRWQTDGVIKRLQSYIEELGGKMRREKE